MAAVLRGASSENASRHSLSTPPKYRSAYVAIVIMMSAYSDFADWSVFKRSGYRFA
jgi:hypothetical protein